LASCLPVFIMYLRTCDHGAATAHSTERPRLHYPAAVGLHSAPCGGYLECHKAADAARVRNQGAAPHRSAASPIWYAPLCAPRVRSCPMLPHWQGSHQVWDQIAAPRRHSAFARQRPCSLSAFQVWIICGLVKDGNMLKHDTEIAHRVRDQAATPRGVLPGLAEAAVPPLHHLAQQRLRQRRRVAAAQPPPVERVVVEQVPAAAWLTCQQLSSKESSLTMFASVPWRKCTQQSPSLR